MTDQATTSAAPGTEAKTHVVGEAVPATPPNPTEEQIARALEEAKQVATTKQVARPRLFTTPTDQVQVEVHVMFRQDNGEVLSVFSSDVKIDLDKLTRFLGHQLLQFTFSKPQYPQIARYRQRSTVLYPDTNTTMVDNGKLRDFLMVYHLRGWNIAGEDGAPLQIKIDPNGAVANETLDVVYSLHPSIIDVVMTTLERKLLLT